MSGSPVIFFHPSPTMTLQKADCAIIHGASPAADLLLYHELSSKKIMRLELLPIDRLPGPGKLLKQGCAGGTCIGCMKDSLQVFGCGAHGRVGENGSQIFTEPLRRQFWVVFFL